MPKQPSNLDDLFGQSPTYASSSDSLLLSSAAPPGPSADSLRSLQQRAMRFGYSALPSSDQALLDSAYKSSKAAKSGLSWEEVKRRMDEAAGRFASPDIRERVAAAQTAAGLDSAAAAPMVREAESELAGLPAYQAADVRGGAYLERGEVPSSLEAILPRFAEYGRRGAGFWDKARGVAGDVLSAPGRMALAETTLPLQAFLNADFSDLNLQHAADWAELPGRTWEGIKKSVTDMPAVMMATDNPITDPGNVVGIGIGAGVSKIPKIGSLLSKLPAALRGAAADAAVGSASGAATAGLEGNDIAPAAIIGAAGDVLGGFIVRGAAKAGEGQLEKAIQSFPGTRKADNAAVAQAWRGDPNVSRGIEEADIEAYLRNLSPTIRDRDALLTDLEAGLERARRPYIAATGAAKADIESGKYYPALYHYDKTPGVPRYRADIPAAERIDPFAAIDRKALLAKHPELREWAAKPEPGPLTPELTRELQEYMANAPGMEKHLEQLEPDALSRRVLREMYGTSGEFAEKYPSSSAKSRAKALEKQVLPRLTRLSREQLADLDITGKLPLPYSEPGYGLLMSRKPMDRRIVESLEPGQPTSGQPQRFSPDDFAALAHDLNLSRKSVGPEKQGEKRLLDEAVLDALRGELLRSPSYRAIIEGTNAPKQYAKAKSLLGHFSTTPETNVSARNWSPTALLPTRMLYTPTGPTNFSEALDRLTYAKKTKAAADLLESLRHGLVQGFGPVVRDGEIQFRGGVGLRSPKK